MSHITKDCNREQLLKLLEEVKGCTIDEDKFYTIKSNESVKEIKSLYMEGPPWDYRTIYSVVLDDGSEHNVAVY